jgi:hypothetical protein
MGTPVVGVRGTASDRPQGSGWVVAALGAVHLCGREEDKKKERKMLTGGPFVEYFVLLFYLR